VLLRPNPEGVRLDPHVADQSKARPDELYADSWIRPSSSHGRPPGNMTGEIHELTGASRRLMHVADFTRRMGTHFAARRPIAGRVAVRCGASSLRGWIVAGVTFDTTDPDLAGELTLVVTSRKCQAERRVRLSLTTCPPGLRPEDNEAGSEPVPSSSLAA